MQTIINAIRSIANSDFMTSENSWFDNAEPQDSAMISFFKTEFKKSVESGLPTLQSNRECTKRKQLVMLSYYIIVHHKKIYRACEYAYMSMRNKI